MNTTYYRQWLQSKLELARFLIDSKGEEAEADAQILLCCAMSAFAATLWPGDRIDRRRFIQLLIEFSLPAANMDFISTPVLANQLYDKNDVSSAAILRRKFFDVHPTQELKTKDVDRPEAEVAALLPTTESKTIRGASYATIVYTDLRCALIHEYSLSPNMTSFNLFGFSDAPSYVNMKLINGQQRRLLHFPYNYIADVLTSTAEALFAYWETVSAWDKAQPAKWWADG